MPRCGDIDAIMYLIAVAVGAFVVAVSMYVVVDVNHKTLHLYLQKSIISYLNKKLSILFFFNINSLYPKK
jgi:hypothetical protein